MLVQRTFAEQQSLIETFMSRTIRHPALDRAEARLLSVARAPAGANIIFLFGPSGVGKSTLITRAVAALSADYREAMLADPSMRPVIAVDAPASSKVFDWVEFYRVGLEELREPIATDLSARSRLGSANQARARFARSLKQHSTRIVIVDEAAHIKAGISDERLESQLNLFKSLSLELDVLFVLAGTYDILPLRDVNPQLGRRGRDVHFRRYRPDGDEYASFRDAVLALLARLPIEHDRAIEREIETLYLRSCGCVGRLKDWLTRALSVALDEGQVLTFKHLEQELPALSLLRAAAEEVHVAEQALRESTLLDLEVRQFLGLGLTDEERVTVEQATTPEPPPGPARTARTKRVRVGRPKPRRQPKGATL